MDQYAPDKVCWDKTNHPVSDNDHVEIYSVASVIGELHLYGETDGACEEKEPEFVAKGCQEDGSDEVEIDERLSEQKQFV